MGHIIKEKKKDITIDMILKEVSSYFSIKASDIKSEKRVRSIMIPRQITIYLSRRLTDASLAGIGEKLGGRDHATIIHSIKRVEEEMKIKKELKEIVEKIELKVKST
jgi:chromosomal replication initiator protein